MSSLSPEFDSPSPEYLSSLLPGYSVNALVSTGIGGSIYDAQQVSLDRKVTIKVLPPGIGKDSVLWTAFEAEAKTMARLNDPNLVDVFDFGEIDGMLYIIMEYVPGRSLHKATHGNKVDPKESARLMADVCRGLSHAHQEGILHRALEPKKILINNEAQPKIVDFGLANLFSQQSKALSNPYSAPEIRTPDQQIDQRADIYSAGMILYELVVGHLPKEPYTAPSSATHCRPEIDHIVYKAIQPDPEQRYTSADEMATDLEEMLEKMGTPPTQEAIKTLVTGTPSLTSRPYSRPVAIPSANSSGNTGLIVTMLVVAILVTIIILVFQSTSKNPEPEQTSTSDNTKTLTAKPKPPKPKPPAKKTTTPTPPENTDITTTPKHPNKPTPPTNNNDTTHSPKPQPTPPPTPEPPKPPEFDREEWLDKARTFIRKKAAHDLIDYDKALLKNIESFERDVKRLVRRLDRGERKRAEARVETAFAEFKELGRLPDEARENSPRQIKQLYRTSLDDQREIDSKFMDDFTRLKVTYTQIINKQTAILRKEGNDEHADALEEEVDDTKDDMDRFMRILRDEDPDQVDQNE